jgi:hypothetical protein
MGCAWGRISKFDAWFPAKYDVMSIGTTRSVEIARY